MVFKNNATKCDSKWWSFHQCKDFPISNLGSMLVCTTNDDQLWKTNVDFVEIKFHLNENNEWHFFFNWIGFKLHWVEFKYIEWILIWNSIEKKCYANWRKRYWIFFSLIWCWIKKSFKTTQIQKTPFHAFFYLGMVKQIQGWNCPSDDYNLWNLTFSYLN